MTHGPHMTNALLQSWLGSLWCGLYDIQTVFVSCVSMLFYLGWWSQHLQHLHSRRLHPRALYHESLFTLQWSH